MASNRNISSTATIFTLTAAAVALVDPTMAQQMTDWLEKQEQQQRNHAKIEKKLTNEIFKQSKFAQEQTLDRTSSNVEKHQSQHHQPQPSHGHGRRR
jgi:hypothetical protein